MKILNIIHSIRDSLKPLVFASAIAISLGASSVQALTTTTVIELGEFPLYTQINPGTLYPRIAVDELPAGSILRKVSWNVRLGNGDPYLGDLAVYFANRAGVGVLQVGATGAFVDGGTLVAADAPTKLPWNAGGNYNYGAAASTTLTALDGVPAIDLHDHSIALETVYPGGWAGTITLEYDIAQPALITSFGPGAVVAEIVSNAAEINWTVPFGTNVTALSPTFTLTTGTCDKVSGGPTTYDFTNPVVYTVTDGATVNAYTVTVTVAPDETTLIWDTINGVWDFSTLNWKGLDSGVSTIFFNGKEVIFDKATGGTITLVAGIEPLSTVVNSSGNYSFTGAPLGGTGSLTKSGSGRLTMPALNSSYSGGTEINAGKLYLYDVQAFTALGTGPVTMNNGVLHLDRVNLANAVTVNGGSFIMDNGFGNTISGNITSNVQLEILSIYTSSQNISGTISGVGGITLNSNFDGGLTLTGPNTYTGDTIVNGGILKVNGSSINDANKLVINGGKVQPTGIEQVASLFFGANPQASGTWGATGSGADHIDDVRFSGTTGVVSVGGAVTLTYSQWASTYYPAANLTDPDEDLDDDGQTNRDEFAFGLNPTSGTSLNPISQLPNKTTGTFKYTRTKNAALTYTYESSTTMIAPWGSFTPVSAVSNNGSPVEEITVTVPPLLLNEPKLFLRVIAQ